jgi:hypothetical protein
MNKLWWNNCRIAFFSVHEVGSKYWISYYCDSQRDGFQEAVLSFLVLRAPQIEKRDQEGFHE